MRGGKMYLESTDSCEESFAEPQLEPLPIPESADEIRELSEVVRFFRLPVDPSSFLAPRNLAIAPLSQPLRDPHEPIDDRRSEVE